MKALLLVLAVASPLTFTFTPGGSLPQTIVIPKCSSAAIPHSIPKPHIPESPVSFPRAPHEVPPGGQLPPGSVFDDVAQSSKTLPTKEAPRLLEGQSHSAVTATDDQARQVTQQFPDPASRLGVTRLSPRLSFQNHLDQPVVQPKLVSLMPSSERDFKNVYSTRSYSQSNKKSLESFKVELDQVNPDQVRKVSTISDLEATINSADGRPVVIFGHTEQQGNVLVLSSGEKIHVSAIHEYCQTTGKACMVLTCNGGDFSIGGRLVATHALKMWIASTKAVSTNAGQPLTVRHFRDEMIRARASLQVAEFVTLSIAATTTAGGGAYVVSSTGDRKKRS